MQLSKCVKCLIIVWGVATASMTALASPSGTAPSPKCHTSLRAAKVIIKPLPSFEDLARGCDTIPAAPMIQLKISSSGAVLGSKLVRSSGCKEADRRIAYWLQYWKYSPAQCHGSKLESTASLVLHLGAGVHARPPSGLLDPEQCPSPQEVTPPKVDVFPLIGGSTHPGFHCSDGLEPTVIDFVVGSDGSVTNLQVFKSSGCKSADSSILQSISRLRFEPARCEGRAVAFRDNSVILW